jgi:7,8-dihydroneopterin aldolase/epimerase/oxygenase
VREVEVAIEGLAVFAHHGARDEEQALGQRFFLDIRMIPLRDAACDTDDLADAVDYGKVARRAHEVASGGPYRLIERLADEVAGAILAEFPVDEVTVRVSKPSAPVPLVIDAAGVTVTRRRSP